MQIEKPRWLKALLFLLFVGGLTLNVLVVSDLEFFGVLQRWRSAGGNSAKPKTPRSTARESLQKSVVLVLVKSCNGGEGNGTGFVVAPGYVITAEHVVADSLKCQSPVLVLDMNERRYPATIEGHSSGDDLALLKIADNVLPALSLADSAPFEEASERVSIFTLGYPLIGGASKPGKAAFSGEGSISTFDKAINRFVSSNLNLNPGNSGGPVILSADSKVIGVALAVLAKFANERPDGIGYVVPSEAVERLFRERTGRNLR